MCIQGTEKIIETGFAFYMAAGTIGAALCISGFVTGMVLNWPGYSIALMSIGGLCLVGGGGGGIALMCRGMHLKQQENETVAKVTEAVKSRFIDL